jgi:hypothetical protein
LLRVVDNTHTVAHRCRIGGASIPLSEARQSTKFRVWLFALQFHTNYFLTAYKNTKIVNKSQYMYAKTTHHRRH